MCFPTLRYPRLCRLLTYLVVLGVFLLPILVTVKLPFVPDIAKMLICFGLLGALLFYLFREFPTLMMLDMCLALLSCYRTARTQYQLPAHCTTAMTERKISRYGTKCAPTGLLPQPSDLRYQFSPSWTIFSRGIERVILTYRTDLLDADTYRAIVNSAKANSKALTGRKKARFLDKQQKKAPLHRVTVIVIFAKQIDPRLVGNLYALVCKQSGDDFEDSVLPCVVDHSRGICTFDSLRVPYVGFGYAAKNRGIRLIRRFVLGGTFPLRNNNAFLSEKDPVSQDQSLWQFWKALRLENGAAQRAIAKKLKGMADREISLEDGFLYIKWGQQGIMLAAEQRPETKTVLLEEIELWSYPKARPIAKETIRSIKQAIADSCKERGWSVVYGDCSESI